MKIFGREPAVWVGLIATIALAVISALAGQGFISEALSGKLTDMTNAAVGLAATLTPLITALVIRQGVTSVAEPKLPVGTPVLIDRPAGLPDDSPPPDAVVAYAAPVGRARKP